jgi:putative heme-binding domain-containing protein
MIRANGYLSLFILLGIFLPGTPGITADDTLRQYIRPTEPLTAAEEEKAFHLPPGFKIRLVVAEPQIDKPVNLAFDARGRIWVSCTVEYPSPAPPDREGRDSIKVLEDTDGDGRADKINTFADGLNLPMGLYPYRRGVIAFSIPYIYYFEDTDGDDRADRRQILYGPLDYSEDHHGLSNAFRRGFDGWIYSCHGYANRSTIRGKDGNQVTLNGGNTYRFRPDGSRVEHFTWGQVNPFGMTFDSLGDIYTADCHSKPITLLLRGGYNKNFSKPHDGLGYVPQIMNHNHGSTGISGAVCYTADRFPAEYHDNLFVGNIVTSRVQRDRMIYHGSTIEAHEEPDFLTTDDPWFRPVDLQIGPDGALYIADFYNRIISHYEVPVDHPGRDRHRGRIWRVFYTGVEERQAAPPGAPLLASGSTTDLVSALGQANLGVRMRATDELTDRIGLQAVDSLESTIHKPRNAAAKVQALWALHRLGKLKPQELVPAAKHPDRLVRIHCMRILAEQASWTKQLREIAVAGLHDPEAMVQRSAAEALGQHPHRTAIRQLLDLLHTAPERDVHLKHVLRMALRNHFRVEGLLHDWRSTEASEADSRSVATILLAVPTEEAASCLVAHMERFEVAQDDLLEFLRHVAKNVPFEKLDSVITLIQKVAATDIDLQLEAMESIRRGLAQRGRYATPSLRKWGLTLARKLLELVKEPELSWIGVSTSDDVDVPWDLEKRESSDGKAETLFISSRPGGGPLTGVLRSKAFVLPASLHFYLCGHLGWPARPAMPRNLARLRLEGSDEIIRETLAPRDTVAQPVEWKLDTHTGKRGYVELVDGLDKRNFSWIAIGRFDSPLLDLPKQSPGVVTRNLRSMALTAEALALEELQPPLRQLVTANFLDRQTRATAARALASFEPEGHFRALAELVSDPTLPDRLRREICATVANPKEEGGSGLATEIMRASPERLQRKLAQSLARSQASADLLLTMVTEGNASPRLLQSAQIRETLLAARPSTAKGRIEELTSSLPPVNEEVLALLEVKTTEHAAEKHSVERGHEIFKKHCTACHQIGGEGKVVGPQLDGVGNRGLERLLEDLLDPNRNVENAFYLTTYVLDDGRVISGLFRREEGETLVIADNRGEEITIQKQAITVKQESKTSLMPEGLARALPTKDFHDLVAYLLSKRVERVKKRE